MADNPQQNGATRAIPLQPLPVDMTLAQAADFLDISHLHLVKLIKRGQLPCLKVGNRRLIPSAALQAYLDNMLENANQAADEMAQLSQDLGLLDLHGPSPKSE